MRPTSQGLPTFLQPWYRRWFHKTNCLQNICIIIIVIVHKIVITCDDSPTGKGLQGVLDTVEQLMTNETFRLEWFQEPILAPTAQPWVAAWCTQFGALVQKALDAQAIK